MGQALHSQGCHGGSAVHAGTGVQPHRHNGGAEHVQKHQGVAEFITHCTHKHTTHSTHS